MSQGQRVDSIIECRVARQLATPRSLHLLIYVLRDIKLAIYCPGFVRDGAAFIFTTLLRIQFAITLLFIPASHVFTPWSIIYAANPLVSPIAQWGD